jgi:hypothetical protein
LLPVNKDQLANRKKKGSSGSRPYAFDTERYKQRHAVEVRDQPAQAQAPTTYKHRFTTAVAGSAAGP